jgi:hypothetical protein
MDYKSYHYPSLDLYIKEHIDVDKLSNTKYRELKENWKQDEKGEYYLNINGLSRYCMLKWIYETNPNCSFVVSYFPLAEKQGKFADLRKLRNRLPIAHSVDSISEMKINKTLKEINFIELMDRFKHILDGMLSKEQPRFPDYFSQLKDFETELRAYIK